MSVEDKIAKVKNRAAQLALKVATAATLISGANVASSCSKTKSQNSKPCNMPNPTSLYRHFTYSPNGYSITMPHYRPVYDIATQVSRQ